MDVFIVIGGTVQNIVVINSMDDALALFPDAEVYPRDERNQHLNPGDIYAVTD